MVDAHGDLGSEFLRGRVAATSTGITTTENLRKRGAFTMPQRAGEVRELHFATTEIEEPLPLIVVPDWDEQLRKASHVAKLIDRHLDYEEHGRRMLPNE